MGSKTPHMCEPQRASCETPELVGCETADHIAAAAPEATPELPEERHGGKGKSSAGGKSRPRQAACAEDAAEDAAEWPDLEPTVAAEWPEPTVAAEWPADLEPTVAAEWPADLKPTVAAEDAAEDAAEWPDLEPTAAAEWPEPTVAAEQDFSLGALTVEPEPADGHAEPGESAGSSEVSEQQDTTQARLNASQDAVRAALSLATAAVNAAHFSEVSILEVEPAALEAVPPSYSVPEDPPEALEPVAIEAVLPFPEALDAEALEAVPPSCSVREEPDAPPIAVLGSLPEALEPGVLDRLEQRTQRARSRRLARRQAAQDSAASAQREAAKKAASAQESAAAAHRSRKSAAFSDAPEFH